MSRVDELQKKYPTLSREFIVKWDCMNHGIKDSDDLYKEKAGIWINGIGIYTRDHSTRLTALVKNRPDGVRPGWIRFPSAFFMRNGNGVSVKRDPRSPYEVREVGHGQFALFEAEEKVEDVWFPGASVGEPGTSDFWPGSTMNGTNKNCGLARGLNAPVYLPLNHCGYFATGDQCKFCNYNANHDDALAVGLRPEKATIDQVIEHYRIRAQKVRIVEAQFGTDGAILGEEKRTNATDFYLDFVGRVASATPSYHPELCLIALPLNRKELQRLKDVGATIVRCQMEVADKELFAEVVPGKAKQYGHEGYLEHLQNAVDIFGVGNVNACFVSGVTLMPETGHKTWQEARNSEIEGYRWMIKHGVVPVYTTFRPVPGSIYGDDKSTLAKMPPTEFYLEVAQGHHGAMKEYGMYEKMNKFVMCPLDCSALYYVGELGMIELAGNPGNWLSDTIPYEANWLAQFVSSVESATTLR